LRGDLKAETESEIIAEQDWALQTNYHATEILKTETNSKCRLCQQYNKTVDCIMYVCPILAKEKYVKLNDIMYVLRYNICKTEVVKLDNDHWYKHIQKSLESS